MQYKIINEGCDDYTEGVFDFTQEQYEFLSDLFEELNENSYYQCMPRIHIMESEEKR